MDVTFDPAKREWTLRIRGLDFSRSPEVFSEAIAVFDDERFEYGEQRKITVGYLDGRMVIIVWTERAGVPGIISMRKANEREQARYRPRR